MNNGGAVKKKIRALIAKVGLDGHNFGAKLVAKMLSDAGIEVVYVEFQTPEEVAQIAVQEDVDLVGLSILSGAHNYLMPECVKFLREQDKGDVLIIAGGIIPKEDIPSLKEAGIAEIWGPGTKTQNIVSFVRSYFSTNEASRLYK